MKYMPLLAAFLLYGGLATLTACGSKSTAEEPHAVRLPGAVHVSGAGGDALVTPITLQDGTRCVVLVGFHKGALTCDWQGERK